MKFYELYEAVSGVPGYQKEKPCLFSFWTVQSAVFGSFFYTMFINGFQGSGFRGQVAKFMNIMKIYEEGLFNGDFWNCLSIVVSFMNFAEWRYFIQVHKCGFRFQVSG